MIKFKSIIALSFILIFLLISLRFAFFISYVKSQKSEFRKQLIASCMASVKKISIRPNQLYRSHRGFEWKENNKELVINGVYHEVVRVERHGSMHEVFIIEDKQENQLFQRYFKLNAREHNKTLNCIIFLDINCTENQNKINLFIASGTLRFGRMIMNDLPLVPVDELIRPPAFRPVSA